METEEIYVREVVSNGLWYVIEEDLVEDVLEVFVDGIDCVVHALLTAIRI